MATFTIGDVVVVEFPFSDLSLAKNRPALVLAPCGGDDYLLCMISSHGYGDPAAMPVPDKDFQSARLEIRCSVRPRHLFSANNKIILRRIGSFSPEFTSKVKKNVSSWINPVTAAL